MSYDVIMGKLGRYIIVNGRDPELAWSGSCWVDHQDGIPTGRAQVSNFTTKEEAEEAAVEAFGPGRHA